MNWNGTDVVVTGAAGFIGSHLVDRLLELGANVTAFARYNSRNDAGFLAPASEHLHIVLGDIRDPEAVREALSDASVVFHMAALVGIPYSYVHPVEVFDVNARGTINVLVAARDLGLKRVVITSSSEVYGTARYVPVDERHPKQPQSPYSASKVAADAMALSFHAAYGLPVAVVRPFNTYGPRKSDRAIIPTIASQALTRDEIRLGSVAPTRDFTFVTDIADGFVRVAESDAFGEEINLGAGVEISIGELAARILAITGRELPIRHAGERDRPRTSEVDRLRSENRKARERIGWQPRVSLDEGLRRTIDWVRGRLDLYAPGAYRI